MASINFYLKDKKSIRPTRIYIQTLHKGVKYKYTTDYKILPKYWNFNKQEVKSSPLSGYLEINKGLVKLKSVVEQAYNEILLSEKFDRDSFRIKIDNLLHKPIKQDLISFISEYIENRNDLSINTKRDYNQTLQTLLNFQKEKKYKLSYNSIDLNFYDLFNSFIIIDLESKPNTFFKRIKVIKTFMNASFERGLHNNLSHRKKAFSSNFQSDKRPYINLDELKLIYNSRVEQKLEIIKDSFLLMCLTGLRISDLEQVNKGNINLVKGEYILSLMTKKNNKKITIPLDDIAVEIIKKYKFKMKTFSDQYFNKQIKIVLKKIGLDREFTNKKGTFKLYELITAHDARRSFATNCYLNDIPANEIMEITGHSRESTFLNYVQEKRTPTAKKLSNVFSVIKESK